MSSELKPIILYDLSCITPGLPWSPNTMKTRYCLGYKQLPFTTTWVEFPDIAPLLRSKGTTQPPYTLPAIEDPNTGVFIVDSLAIATYLDEQYPDTPKVLTPKARAILEKMEGAFSSGARSGGASGQAGPEPRLVFPVLTLDRLNPVSRAFYHESRTERQGGQWTAMVDACAAGPEASAECARRGVEAIEDTWRKATGLYVPESEGGLGTSSGPFVLGEVPCFVDFDIAGRVKYMLDAVASIPSEVEILKNLEGGRLIKLVEDLEKYYKY